MDYAKQIKEQMKKKGGVITSRELRDFHIPTIYLTRMVEAGVIIRVDRGIYTFPDGDYDEYFFFQKRYQVPIFSYVSALHLHQYTDIIPEEMEITVYSGYNPHRIRKNIRIHYVSKAIYQMGLTECETPFGNLVKVYDLERTICDLIKSRREIETELFSKTILQYVRDKSKDLNKLYEYSQKMKISNRVQDIIELVLG